jgi:hypothetical protein
MKIENAGTRRRQGSLKAGWQRETSKDHLEKRRNGIGSGAKQRQNQRAKMRKGGPQSVRGAPQGSSTSRRANPNSYHTSLRIDDRPPEEEEVKKGVQKMNSGKAAGATGTAVQHVKEWMAGAEDEEHPTHVKEWRMVLDFVECCFTNNADAPRAFEIGTLALMPKDVTSYCGIVLLETIYKLALMIVTFRLSNVEFQDAVHRHQAKWGTGTAIIKFKLLTQCTKNCGEENHYVMFLDLQKACYMLDRTRTLVILEWYGVRPNI